MRAKKKQPNKNSAGHVFYVLWVHKTTTSQTPIWRTSICMEIWQLPFQISIKNEYTLSLHQKSQPFFKSNRRRIRSLLMFKAPGLGKRTVYVTAPKEWSLKCPTFRQEILDTKDLHFIKLNAFQLILSCSSDKCSASAHAIYWASASMNENIQLSVDTLLRRIKITRVNTSGCISIFGQGNCFSLWSIPFKT